MPSTEDFEFVAHCGISKQGKLFTSSFERQEKYIDVLS